MHRLEFYLAMGDVGIFVAERAEDPGVFDARFSPEPTVGPAGFTIGSVGPQAATASRTFLEQEVRRTVAAYGPDELSWT